MPDGPEGRWHATAFPGTPTDPPAPSESTREAATSGRPLLAPSQSLAQSRAWPRIGRARVSLRGLRCARVVIEPCLGSREAHKPRNCRGEIDRFPLRIKARRLQLVDP